MKKILVIIPHLSTGGLPQVVVNKVELLKDTYDVKCIEYCNHGPAFVVQRNRLIDLVGESNLITLWEEDKTPLLKLISEFNPDIISMEEFPEFFMGDDITKEIYNKSNRNYKIFETTHDSSFSVNSKRWFPDKFIFVSAFNAFRYSCYDIPYEIIEYPIDRKERNKSWAQTQLNLDPTYKHVVCVGLFTQRKNQGYLFDVARKLNNKKILFHFIGNQADNFMYYWEPLMKNKPDNCIVWGERSDVDTFLQASDLFFFPSKGDKNNKELNPIAIKEALTYNLPMMMFNLGVYCGKYNKEKNITFLTGNEEMDRMNLVNVLEIQNEKQTDMKKVFIIDVFAKTEEKKKLLKKCIESVKNFGYDIILVGHCSLPEEIIQSVNYYIYDSDNRFNKNHVYSFRVIGDVEIRKNIFKSHEYPIIRSMRLAFNLAKSMGYEFFHFSEFDHVYSDNSVKEILRLESEVITQGKNYLFFRPPHAKFAELVGEYYESCFFSGYIDKFINDFDSYFPKTLDEYNNKFSIRLPNCLEHFFFELFRDKNSIVVEDYVKSYFKDSLINISSYQDTTSDILLSEDGDPYLVLSNNNHYDLKYEIFFNDVLHDTFILKGFTKLIKIPYSSNIRIKRYNGDVLDETIDMVYDELKKEEYKMNGTIINLNKQPKIFDVVYEPQENKIIFTYNLDTPKKILVSIKDIDSHVCIYSFHHGDCKGCSYWTIPLPKSVIDFELNPNFGGFLIEYRENGVLLGYDQIRIKEIQTTKPVYDFSDSEPIFMNYVEFFEDKIYDNFDIHNLGVVFDVGASVGLWSQFILSRGAKKVYSFEPNKRAQEHLYKNLSGNDRVTIIPYGLYNEKTKIPFYVDENNSLISSTMTENVTSPTPTYYIETVTLDEIISKYNIEKIDLLKMDIEGAEFPIFENISNETLSKIDSVLIEYHGFYFEDGDKKIDDLVNKLKSSGFHITKPENVKFIFGYKTKKNYWVDVQDNIELRNLYDYSKTFSWENMNKGVQNGYHHMFNELHFTYDQYTNGCIYERYGCKIEKNDVVVDIGANIGGFANVAFEKGASKVYCFEPSDLSFNCLIRNKPKNCEVFKMAVSDHIGFDVIFSPTKNDTMSATLLSIGSESNICPTITIDNLFENNVFKKIDFLKIDVEGSEIKIINGISDENLSNINKISIEIHSKYTSTDDLEKMSNRMNEKGFKSFTLFLGSEDLKIINFWR
jgi:FkbM family methyltransferase